MTRPLATPPQPEETAPEPLSAERRAGLRAVAEAVCEFCGAPDPDPESVCEFCDGYGRDPEAEAEDAS